MKETIEFDIPIVKGYSSTAHRFIEGQAFPRLDSGVTMTEAIGKNIYLHQVFPESITGYTGFRDRNGKNIFIGDIIKIDFLSGLYYIYSVDPRDNCSVLIHMDNLTDKNLNLSKVEKIVMDFSAPAGSQLVTDHIEVTGSLISQIIPGLRQKLNKDGKMTNVYGEDEELTEEEIEDFEEIDPENIDLDFYDEVEIISTDEEPEPEPVVDEEPEHQIRGLSMDLQTWLTGKCFMHTDMEGIKTFTIFNPSTYKVGEAVPDTLGISSGIFDRTGREIFDGDVILLENKAAFVIRHKLEYDKFCILQYNLYPTVASENIVNWKPCIEETWKKSSEDILIIGDVHRGIDDDFLNDYHSGKYGHIPSLEEFKGEIKEDNDPLREIAYSIDSVVHGLNPNIKAFYYSEWNSRYNEEILHCKWKLESGDMLHGYYNMHTGENAVHFGYYEPSPDYDKNHRLIGYHKEGFHNFINELANILMIDTKSRIYVEAGMKTPASVSSETVPMKKGWSLERLLKDKFENPSTISQRKFREEVVKLYTDNRFAKIAVRAQDCSGVWMHGELIYTHEGDSYIEIYDKGKYYYEEFLVSSVCENTFLQDKDGNYIYSCDIVSYNGKLYAVYMSDDIDPNDASNLTENDSGFMYTYFIEYEKLNDVIMSNSDNIKKLQWRPINFAEWIRRKDDITVVGNITDNPPLNPQACLNSDDFSHDDDSLPLIYPKEELMYINPTADALYFHNKNKSMEENEEEITFVAEDIMGLDLENDSVGYVSSVFHSSDFQKSRIKQIALFIGDTAELRLMWPYPALFTISLGHNTTHTESMGIYRIGVDHREASKICRDITKTDEFKAQLYYNFPFTTPTGKLKEAIDKISSECSKNRNLRFETQGDYMDALRKLKVPEKDIRNVQCRAMSIYGQWIIGYLNETLDKIVSPVSGVEFFYIRESLGFNTYMTDAGGKFIFDNDIAMFKGKGSNLSGAGINYMVFNRLSYMIYLDDVPITVGMTDLKANENILRNKIREPLIRVQYESLTSGIENEDRTKCQFIEVDIAYFLRNRDRIVVVGDTMTNNLEIDTF